MKASEAKKLPAYGRQPGEAVPANATCAFHLSVMDPKCSPSGVTHESPGYFVSGASLFACEHHAEVAASFANVAPFERIEGRRA